jgi:hypothetical protein
MISTKIKNVLKDLDIFGVNIRLLVNKEETAKTLIGGFLTLISYIAFTLIFIFSSLDIFEKLKPNVTVENKKLDYYPRLELNKYSFPLSISFQDAYGANYDIPEYFFIDAKTAIINSTDINSEPIIRDLTLEKCTTSHFPSISVEAFYSGGAQNYLCIKDQNVSLSGYYGQESIEYFYFNGRTCKNDTERNITCASEEEIENFLKNVTLYLTVFYQNNVINTQKYNNFIESFIENRYRAVKYGFVKNFDIFLKTQMMESDNGFLTEFVQHSQVITSDKEDYDFGDLDNTGILITMAFYPTNKQEIFRRNYLKIQEAMARTGALTEVFIRLFGLICKLFSSTALNKYILNNIYDFDLGMNQDEDEIKLKNTGLKSIVMSQFMNNKNELYENDNSSMKILSINNIKNSYVKSNSNLSMEKQIQVNQDNHSPVEKKKIVKFLENSKNNLLTLSWTEIIQMYCCFSVPFSLREKRNLYEKSLNSLKELLDISYILQKIESFEKLKLLLLSYDQLVLFKYVSKDLCSLYESKYAKPTINHLKEINNDNIEKLSETILKFKGRFKKHTDDLTEFDKKLFDLLRDDLKI